MPGQEKKPYLRVKPVGLVFIGGGFAPSSALGLGGGTHSPSPPPAAREAFCAWRDSKSTTPENDIEKGRRRA